jgi:hypothetical protein
MHQFPDRQEAAQDPFAALGVTAARKAAQVTAQMFEPIFAQIGRAQPVSPLRPEVEKREHFFHLELEFLDHLRYGPTPARTESWRHRFQVPKPMRQAALLPRRRIHRLRRTDDRGQSICRQTCSTTSPSATLPSSDAVIGRLLSSTPARAVGSGDTLSFSAPTFNRKSYRRQLHAP